MVGILGIDLAGADPNEPTVGEREYAGLDDPNETKSGWEPAIAAGPDTTITVFHTHTVGVRYGIYDPEEEGWVAEATIDPEHYVGAHDPAIAYNSMTGEFVAAARTSGGRILTSHFTPDPNAPNGFGEFGPWVSRKKGGVLHMDMPWIVAGEMTGSVQEFYITHHTPLGYLRSIDGGLHWAWDEMIDGETGEPITGGGTARPAVYGDRPLYVSYVKLCSGPSFEIRFLVGEDVDGDPNDPNFDPNDPNYVGVSFCHLYGIWSFLDGPVRPVRLKVPLNNHELQYNTHLPGNFSWGAPVVPQLAVDPNDPDRLYVVYHDLATDDPNDPDYDDVNIYMHRFTRPGGTWILSPRIKVNNDDTPFEADQFLPSITVDHAGRIHISFYDDRNYEDQQDSEPKPKYDAFYAYSDNHGDTWTNVRLPGDPNNPNEPALDWNLKKVDPHDYNGITCYGDTVWTTYAGTWSQDPGNKAVISSNRLDWPAP